MDKAGANDPRDTMTKNRDEHCRDRQPIHFLTAQIYFGNLVFA